MNYKYAKTHFGILFSTLKMFFKKKKRENKLTAAAAAPTAKIFTNTLGTYQIPLIVFHSFFFYFFLISPRRLYKAAMLITLKTENYSAKLNLVVQTIFILPNH